MKALITTTPNFDDAVNQEEQLEKIITQKWIACWPEGMEAWADYRYRTNMVTSEMRSSYAQTLDAWHYADKYDDLPKLSSTWIKEGTENIDRTLAVQSSNSHQFICNFFYEQAWTRPMPIYSVPGIDTI